MDRFITRIPKPPQNAVINQIRAVPEVSSKQASAEKISHEFIKKYFLEYNGCKKWKKIILQGLLNFSGCLEKETFTCDWAEVSGDGLKKEHFNRDSKHASHEKWTKNYESIVWNYGQQNRRNACQALSSKLIAQTQAPLGTKIIFVASNFLACHHIGINNYGYLIGAFQNAGAPVTSTQRNKEGFNLFCSVQSDRILLGQKQRKQKIRILEQISMVVWIRGEIIPVYSWTLLKCFREKSLEVYFSEVWER